MKKPIRPGGSYRSLSGTYVPGSLTPAQAGRQIGKLIAEDKRDSGRNLAAKAMRGNPGKVRLP